MIDIEADLRADNIRLQEKNRELNRRAQAADAAAADAKRCLDALAAGTEKGTPWCGGNLGRGLLAWHVSRLEDILKGYEQWEANLVLNANWEATPDGLPALTYPLYDELMALQGRRNEALGRGPFKRKEPASV
jgi:hypothetical protein